MQIGCSVGCMQQVRELLATVDEVVRGISRGVLLYMRGYTLFVLRSVSYGTEGIYVCFEWKGTSGKGSMQLVFGSITQVLLVLSG